MQTVYDWTTMIVFAGLVVLFLQRSQGEVRDELWHYMVAALGCAATNYVGNEGHDVIAVAMLAATLAFIFMVLRPLDAFRN